MVDFLIINHTLYRRKAHDYNVGPKAHLEWHRASTADKFHKNREGMYYAGIIMTTLQRYPRGTFPDLRFRADVRRCDGGDGESARLSLSWCGTLMGAGQWDHYDGFSVPTHGRRSSLRGRSDSHGRWLSEENDPRAPLTPLFDGVDEAAAKVWRHEANSPSPLSPYMVLPGYHDAPCMVSHETA